MELTKQTYSYSSKRSKKLPIKTFTGAPTGFRLLLTLTVISTLAITGLTIIKVSAKPRLPLPNKPTISQLEGAGYDCEGGGTVTICTKCTVQKGGKKVCSEYTCDRLGSRTCVHTGGPRELSRRRHRIFIPTDPTHTINR